MILVLISTDPEEGCFAPLAQALPSSSDPRTGIHPLHPENAIESPHVLYSLVLSWRFVSGLRRKKNNNLQIDVTPVRVPLWWNPIRAEIEDETSRQ